MRTKPQAITQRQSRTDQQTNMAMNIGVHQAKIHLSDLLRRVEQGETITIERYGKPVARLVAIQEQPLKPRPLGLWKGTWAVTDDAFSQETEDEVAALFNR